MCRSIFCYLQFCVGIFFVKLLLKQYLKSLYFLKNYSVFIKKLNTNSKMDKFYLAKTCIHEFHN